jgi:CHAT domain-containing protein
VFVVTADRAAALSLPEAAHPDQPVASLAGLVGRRDGSEPAGAARLYDVLLGRALARLTPGVRRLVIVPDAALHRLPFDALRPQPDSPTLGERYEITLVPSASLWLRLRERPREARHGLLALADPRWSGPEAVAVERQAVLWQGMALGRLPRGQVEARGALRSLQGGGRLLIGRAATERFLKTADLQGFGVLHLAAHAVVDDDHPSRSAIVLAPGGPGEDGLLQSREIVGLDLSGLVVVLSACRSTGGAVLPGEGPLSLARAFLQAGARAVVGNLWEVRDDEAELLMAAFYRRLGEGATVGAALAAARRERALAGAPAAAWAGTLVVGDGEATVRPPPGASVAGGTLGPAAALACTSLLALAAFRYGRGRRLRAPASPAPSGAPAGPTPARP